MVLWLKKIVERLQMTSGQVVVRSERPLKVNHVDSGYRKSQSRIRHSINWR